MENRSTPEETLQNLVPEKEVMEILGVSRGSLDRLRHKKQLPFIRVNRKSRLYLESSLMKWVRDLEIVLDRDA